MVDSSNDTDLYSRIVPILQKVAYNSAVIPHITSDTRLQEDLDLDSARLVDLILNLEDDFGIRIEDGEIERLKTVGDLVNLIKTTAESKPGV